MRKSTLLSGIVSMLCMSGTLLMWRAWQQEKARGDALELAVAQEQGHEHTTERSSPDQRPASAGPIPASRTHEPPSVVAQPSADAAENSSRRGAGTFWEPSQRMLKDPEFRKAYRGQQRASIEAAYYDLQKALNLSPEKAAQVFDLLADQVVEQSGWQLRSDSDDDVAAFRRALEEKRARDDAEMTKLLGPSGVEQLRDYRKSYQSRAEVNQLRSDLSSGPEPLREDQFQPILAVVYAEQQRMDQELTDFQATASSDELGRGITDTKRAELAMAANERILDSARSVLSAAQLATLADLYRRQNQQMKAQMELMRLNREARIKEAQAAKAN